MFNNFFNSTGTINLLTIMNIDEEIKSLEKTKAHYLELIASNKAAVNDCSLKIRRLERLKKEMNEIINPTKAVNIVDEDIIFKDPKQLEIEEVDEEDKFLIKQQSDGLARIFPNEVVHTSQDGHLIQPDETKGDRNIYAKDETLTSIDDFLNDVM